MLKISVYSIPVITSTILLGCASNPGDCDPKKGGFVSGISAMASGCYEQRVSDKRSSAQAVGSQTAALSAENRDLQTQKRLSSSQKSQAQKKLAALKANNADLEARVARMQTNTDSAQQEKARLEQQLRQSKTDAAVLERKVQSDAISAQDLDKQVAALTKDRDDVANAIANSMVVQ